MLVVMASKKYAFFNSGKYISAVESKLLSILSIVESYVKSKCRALVKLRISFVIYLRETREKMASRSSKLMTKHPCKQKESVFTLLE